MTTKRNYSTLRTINLTVNTFIFCHFPFCMTVMLTRTEDMQGQGPSPQGPGQERGLDLQGQGLDSQGPGQGLKFGP